MSDTLTAGEAFQMLARIQDHLSDLLATGATS
jgi:hypothetical protein